MKLFLLSDTAAAWQLSGSWKFSDKMFVLWGFMRLQELCYCHKEKLHTNVEVRICESHLFGFCSIPSVWKSFSCRLLRNVLVLLWFRHHDAKKQECPWTLENSSQVLNFQSGVFNFPSLLEGRKGKKKKNRLKKKNFLLSSLETSTQRVHLRGDTSDVFLCAARKLGQNQVHPATDRLSSTPDQVSAALINPDWSCVLGQSEKWISGSVVWRVNRLTGRRCFQRYQNTTSWERCVNVALASLVFTRQQWCLLPSVITWSNTRWKICSAVASSTELSLFSLLLKCI